MQYFKNILCVEVGWMIDNQLITKDKYDSMSRRRQLNVIRRGSRNTTALVAYESLPLVIKAEVDRRVGDPYAVARINELSTVITHSTEASDFFEQYKTADGRYLPVETRREYYANAVVLNAIDHLMMTKVRTARMQGRPTGGKWEYMLRQIAGLDKTQYPCAMPDNARSLERKYKRYKQEGYASLIHANFRLGVKNAASVITKVQKGFLIKLLAHPNNFDDQYIADSYNLLAENAGWKMITRVTVLNKRKQWAMEIHAARHGVVSFDNKYSMQVKRSRPSFPLYMLTMDGWDVELLYQQWTGRKTEYSKRVNVVMVLDPCTNYILGYAIGVAESPELIRQALRNTMYHTVELFGDLYRPHQLQSDRYQIKHMMPTYKAVALYAVPAKAKNAKSKVIEPYFNRFNKEYCQKMPNWSGHNITAKQENQPNIEHLNRIHKSFPDYEGVCKQIDYIIAVERKKKEAQYLALWNDMPQEDKVKMSLTDYLYIFGETTGHKNILQPSGVVVTIEGRKHTYDCFELEFRRHTAVRWNIKYDPNDSSRVLAMNDDETLKFVLEEKYLQPMALKDRKEGDYEELRKVWNFNKEVLKPYVTDFLCSHNEAADQYITENDVHLGGILSGKMLVDSKGQHKDQRNLALGRVGERKQITHQPVVAPEDDIYDRF